MVRNQFNCDTTENLDSVEGLYCLDRKPAYQAILVTIYFHTFDNANNGKH